MQNPTITEEECCHITENYKTDFIFNSNQHTDFELIFIENGAGLRRIVGDSMEYIDNYELILICENKLEHLWEKGVCKSKMIRIINIQFPPDLIGEAQGAKDQIAAMIRKMITAIKTAPRTNPESRMSGRSSRLLKYPPPTCGLPPLALALFFRQVSVS